MIEVENLSKSFGQEQVLKDVNRHFAAGQIHGIVGGNGSGKTVLMKCICGFLTPTKGRVLVRGGQVGKDFDFPPNLGLIIETPGFLPRLSGVQNLGILADLNRKIGLPEIKAAIELVGLDPKSKKPVGKYSLGMRQRLGLAQAIMEDPDLLILDEPLNGLDKKGAAEMRQLILAQKEQGKTILLTSHNQQDIDLLCDTVCEMDGGVMTPIRESPPPAQEPPQEAPLVEELTILENLALTRKSGAKLLKNAGLYHLRNAKPSQISPWQRTAILKLQKEEP